MGGAQCAALGEIRGLWEGGGVMDQCLQVFLLSGLFSIRSASSLESTESTPFVAYLSLARLRLA